MGSKTKVVKKPTVENLSNGVKIIKFEADINVMMDSINEWYKENFNIKEDLPSIKDVPGINEFLNKI